MKQAEIVIDKKNITINIIIEPSVTIIEKKNITISMIIETSPERRSYTIPLYITIGPFTWNIVTLSITENKFINNPFIVCLEWYLSWKIVTLSITEGNLLNNPFILLVVCAWNGTYPEKQYYTNILSFWEDKCKRRCN